MAKMMLATKTNSTSIHFGMDHMCHRHNVLFTLEHIVECDALDNCDKIREYSNRLKVQHILEWEKEERLVAIAQYASLTV